MKLTSPSIILLILLPSFLMSQTREFKGIEAYEKKAEKFVANRLKSQPYTTIEFGELTSFNIDEIVQYHLKPTIYADYPFAIDSNKAFIKKVRDFSRKNKIAYSLSLIYGYKADVTDEAWIPEWCMVFFGENLVPIQYLSYYP